MSKNAFPLAVLWDMDGTLVDSEHYWSISQNRLAQQYGATWTEEDEKGVIGSSLYDSSDLIKRKLALELLLDLKQAGIKTALVTMSMRRMALAVAESIPFAAFDVVIAGDDVKYGKPHPEPYLKAAKSLGVDPADCIAFEDSMTGLNSAAAAGTHAIGVTNLVELTPGNDRRVIDSLVGLSSSNLHELRLYA